MKQVSLSTSDTRVFVYVGGDVVFTYPLPVGDEPSGCDAVVDVVNAIIEAQK